MTQIYEVDKDKLLDEIHAAARALEAHAEDHPHTNWSAVSQGRASGLLYAKAIVERHCKVVDNSDPTC